MGSELDEEGPLFLRAARRFRVRGGHSLQWELLRHLLAEEAWADARAHVLERADFPRRGLALRLRLLDLQADEAQVGRRDGA